MIFFCTMDITLVCWKKQLITAVTFLMGCEASVTSSVKLALSMCTKLALSMYKKYVPLYISCKNGMVCSSGDWESTFFLIKLILVGKLELE